MNTPGYYNTWERYWLTGGDSKSEARTQKGDLLARTVRAMARERAMSQPMTSRCGFCEWHSTGPAGETLEAYRTHKCRKAKA